MSNKVPGQIQVVDENGKDVWVDAETHLVRVSSGGLRRVPHHVFPFSLCLVVNGEPQIASDQHVVALGLFACVDQKTGQVVNGNDRTRALVAIFPEGKYECINLDNPDERHYRHVQFGKNRTPLPGT